MMFEAILFDVGDTLIHFETSHLGKFVRSAATPVWDHLHEWKMNPPPLSRYRRALKVTAVREMIWSRLRRREAQLPKAFRARHNRFGIQLTDDQWTELVYLCIPVLRQFFRADEEAVGVMRQLQALKIKMGLVSNTVFPGFAIDDVLEHDGLLEWFPVRIYSSDVGYMKPHPKIFEIALEQLKVGADQTIFVGDRIDKDVKGASRLGMKTVLLSRTGETPRGRSRPDHVIQRLSQIPTLVGA